MEPVTHVLTGMCLARTGFNRKTAYAVATMAVAAEFPDIDTLWSLRGPVESFQHHRGITHTFLGLPFEAALIVGGVWAWHWWRVGRHRASPLMRDGAAHEWATPRSAPVPVRWGWLYGVALVALLSHLLLDYTNNYGIRPFFPFDRHWYAGSIVFIFDPLLFLLLAAALVGPSLFGLIGSEVGARRQRFRGRSWAVAGLLGVVAWWGLRAVEHGRAVELAQGQVIAAPAVSALSPELSQEEVKGDSNGAGATFSPPTSQNRDVGHPFSVVIPGEGGEAEAAPVYLQARRTLASPDPLSPFRWSAVTDFGPVYGQSEIDSLRGTLNASDVLTPKPGADAAVRAAEASRLGRAYLDWSPMPFLAEERGPDGGAVITFRDPRFLGGWMAAHGRVALAGTVQENARGQVVALRLDGRVER